jgi:uncharacterized protein
MKKLQLFLLLVIFISNMSFAQAKVKQLENCGNTKTKNKINKMDSTQLNVLGQPLALASIDPLTGYYRNGYCQTDINDRGLHVVAAIVTDEFLQYSKQKGNDLITPYPESNFPGLKAGDVWCLCVMRWKEALDAGVAPPVVLEATNIKALQFVSLDQLKSVKLN